MPLPKITFLVLVLTTGKLFGITTRERTLRRHVGAPRPPTDWELGLREAVHQALLREHHYEPALHEHLLAAPFIGRKNIASPFGDIAVLARGQLYAVPEGFKFVQDSDCDCYKCECQLWKHLGHPHKLVALWTVKRIRHRDPHYGHIFEIEYTISPITSVLNEDLVMREGVFNYNVPGHIFVVKTMPNVGQNYYEHKYVGGHGKGNFKQAVVIGVGPDGYKHVLQSFPGFYSSYHPQHTDHTTIDPKEYELYKKLIESLAEKTTPHRFEVGGKQKVIVPTYQQTTPVKFPQTTTTYVQFPQEMVPTYHQTSTSQIVPTSQSTTQLQQFPTNILTTYHYTSQMKPEYQQIPTSQAPPSESTTSHTQFKSKSTTKFQHTTQHHTTQMVPAYSQIPTSQVPTFQSTTTQQLPKETLSTYYHTKHVVPAYSPTSTSQGTSTSQSTQRTTIKIPSPIYHHTTHPTYQQTFPSTTQIQVEPTYQTTLTQFPIKPEPIPTYPQTTTYHIVTTPAKAVTTQPGRYYHTLPTKKPTIERPKPITMPVTTIHYYMPIDEPEVPPTQTTTRKYIKYSKKPYYTRYSTRRKTTTTTTELPKLTYPEVVHEQVPTPSNTQSTMPYVVSTVTPTTTPKLTTTEQSTSLSTVTNPESTVSSQPTTVVEYSSSSANKQTTIFAATESETTRAVPSSTTQFYIELPATTSHYTTASEVPTTINQNASTITITEVPSTASEVTKFTSTDNFLVDTENVQRSTSQTSIRGEIDDDIFGKLPSSSSTERIGTTTTKKPYSPSDIDQELFGSPRFKQSAKVIYKNFYKPSSEKPLESTSLKPVTRQSVSTSVSIEVHRRSSDTKQSENNETDEILVTSGTKTKVETKKVFENAALQLVNHARSINYLNKKVPKVAKHTTMPKYRRRSYSTRLKKHNRRVKT